MALVDSLLTAMVRANGDALVMHVGEKPIVVARSRSIDLSSHGLNLNAMVGMLAQLLPAEAQASLAEFGAVEHCLPPRGSDHFTVVAARGGDDIWIEIRRRREESRREAQTTERSTTAPEAISPEPVAPEPVPAAPAVEESPADEQAPVAVQAGPAEDGASNEALAPAAGEAPAEGQPSVPEAAPAVEAPAVAEAEPTVASTQEADRAAEAERLIAAEAMVEREPVVELEPVEDVTPAPLSALAESEDQPRTRALDQDSAPEFRSVRDVAPDRDVRPETADSPSVATSPPDEEPVMARVTAPRPIEEPLAEMTGLSDNAMTEALQAAAPAAEQEDAAVMPDAEIPTPMTQGLMASPLTPDAGMSDAQSAGAVAAAGAARTQATAAGSVPGVDAPDAGAVTRTVRIEVPARSSAQRTARAERLLRLAVERGATELFLMTQGRPYLRVDGEVRLLQDEAALSAADLEDVLSDITPEPSRDAVSRGERVEWLVELADVGRVRCASFRDHRGPGAVFHLLSTRAATVEQLGLAPEARSLASEPDGLVIVAGPAGSDKSAILAAFVDEINRHRADYMITIEPCVYLVHENVHALVSQREVGTDPARAAAAMRDALSENPDVLVIDDLASGDVAALAVQAAAQGRLVLVSLEAGSTAEAVQRLIDLVPAERRSATREALARTFRGAIAQQLLRKSAGGRVAARELLMGTGAVSRVLADHARPDVAQAIEAACDGTPLADAVAGFVKSGAVDVREAFRKAPNRERLVTALRAAGVSTASIDRLQ
ncbi:MAG: ATPase, T2SS/T4P/T4SS family [Vicinamibacterales bacterium]